MELLSPRGFRTSPSVPELKDACPTQSGTCRGEEERHRRLFELNPAPSWVIDCETQRFLAVNEAAIRHYGYSREEFLSMRATQIHQPEEAVELERTLAMGEDYLESGPWRQLKKDEVREGTF